MRQVTPRESDSCARGNLRSHVSRYRGYVDCGNWVISLSTRRSACPSPARASAHYPRNQYRHSGVANLLRPRRSGVACVASPALRRRSRSSTRIPGRMAVLRAARWLLPLQTLHGERVRRLGQPAGRPTRSASANGGQRLTRASSLGRVLILASEAAKELQSFPGVVLPARRNWGEPPLLVRRLEDQPSLLVSAAHSCTDRPRASSLDCTPLDDRSGNSRLPHSATLTPPPLCELRRDLPDAPSDAAAVGELSRLHAARSCGRRANAEAAPCRDRVGAELA